MLARESCGATFIRIIKALVSLPKGGYITQQLQMDAWTDKQTADAGLHE